MLRIFVVCSLAACAPAEDEESVQENRAPIADAGVSGDVVVEDGGVFLDGCASHDLDGEGLSFDWDFDYVPDASSLAEAAAPFESDETTACVSSFVPDQLGTYVVSLVVIDGRGLSSDAAFVSLNVHASESPIANAGPDQTATVGERIALDAAGSDGLGRGLDYQWAFTEIPSGSTASLDAPSDIEASFVADRAGAYVIALVVDDGLTGSLPDLVRVDVSLENQNPPIANAGSDLVAEDCTEIPLAGNKSFDPDEGALVYDWRLQTSPEGSGASDANIASPTDPVTTFYPDVAGEYQLSLAVFDGSDWSEPDTVQVTAIERTYNTPPDVFAGADQRTKRVAPCDGVSCGTCEDVTFSLAKEAVVSDVDGDPFTYHWEAASDDVQIASDTSLDTAITVSGAEAVTPSVCTATHYEVKLVASDCPGATTEDTVVLTVDCCGLLE